MVTAQNSILENEERLRLAEEAGQIGSWEWDPARQSQTLSAELGRIFGVDVSDPDQAQKWSARVWPEDWPKVQQLMELGSRSGAMEF